MDEYYFFMILHFDDVIIIWSFIGGLYINGIEGTWLEFRETNTLFITHLSWGWGGEYIHQAYREKVWENKYRTKRQRLVYLTIYYTNE